jgi:uncharacterized membrane protein
LGNSPDNNLPVDAARRKYLLHVKLYGALVIIVIHVLSAAVTPPRFPLEIGPGKICSCCVRVGDFVGDIVVGVLVGFLVGEFESITHPHRTYAIPLPQSVKPVLYH